MIGALLCAVSAGCSTGTSDALSHHVGTYEATGEGGDGALLEGTVRLADGCFLVESTTSERFLVYFPGNEVGWSDKGLRYAGTTYGAGDSIVLGGGASSGSWPVPSACRERFEALPQWIVAQSG
ncbi:hypothetical protein [Nocardioides sp. SYSU D00065]|uniref:hypothetical protein n=1 Tax=Nocardioides sp. SYSU D00065 TaxID=2817378 RepID=UPI001B32D92D|nr:hypothetical protein [Nocardioides sp. SYSU D00065]